MITDANTSMIPEEIRPSDTFDSFYNRVHSIVLEKFRENSDSNFILLIKYHIDSLSKEQNRIITEPIPPEIPIKVPPVFLAYGIGSLQNLRASMVIDCGQREETEIDQISGIKTIKKRKITSRERNENIEKLAETENAKVVEFEIGKEHEEEYNYDLSSSRCNIYSFILGGLRYAGGYSESYSDDYSDEFNHLVGLGLIDKNGILTDNGAVAAQFDGLLLFEYVNLSCFVQSQSDDNQMSACLFCLLLQQIMKVGKAIINEPYSKSFLDNFDERSDIVTLLKVLLPTLNIGRTDLSLFSNAGLNPDICKNIVDTIEDYYNNADDIKNYPDSFDDAINGLQTFLKDIYQKVNEYIFVIEKGDDNSNFINKHNLTFKDISDDSAISIILEDKENNQVTLSFRPGWNGYSMPSAVFAFCVDYNDFDGSSQASMIHTVDPDKMIICSCRILEELDNPFVSTVLSTLINRENYCSFHNQSYSITNSVNHYSFLSFCPLVNDYDYRNEIKAALNLISNVLPYLPRSLLVHYPSHSAIVELRSDNISELSSMTYIYNDDQNVPPSLKPPFAYSITQRSISYLSHYTDELRGHFPKYRFAVTADDFAFDGNHSKILVNKKQRDVNTLNQKLISPPNVGSESCGYVFEIPSHLIILSDVKNDDLGNQLNFFQHSDSTVQQVTNSCAGYLPSTAKLYSNSIAFFVNLTNATFSLDGVIDDEQYTATWWNDNPKRIIDNNGNIMATFSEFLNHLNMFVSNSSVNFPQDISLTSRYTGSKETRFDFDSIKSKIVSMLGVPDDFVSLRPIGNYCFFVKLLIGINSEQSMFDEAAKAITAATNEYGKVVISNPPVELQTFVFTVEKYQGITLKERLEKVQKATKVFNLFCFDLPKEKKNISSQILGKIEVDIMSNSAWISFSKLIQQIFADDQITKIFNIPYPHPVLIPHEKTKDTIDNWVASNIEERSTMHKEDGIYWVGKISDVNLLEKRLKSDINNNIFRFEYQPYVVPPGRFKNLKEKFETNNFQDYEYSKLYNILIMKCADARKYKVDKSSSISIDKDTFCLALCRGSIPYSKRVPSFDEFGNVVMLSFCPTCTLNTIKEITKPYYTPGNFGIDFGDISKDGETFWRPLKLFDDRPNVSIPLGQLIYYLAELDRNYVDFLRAWVYASSRLAMLQCPMFIFCPIHVSQIIRVKNIFSKDDKKDDKNDEKNDKKKSKRKKNKKDDKEEWIECTSNGCGLKYHTECKRWHEDGKKECSMKIVEERTCRRECPKCGLPSYNFFGCSLMRCACGKCCWCLKCHKVLEQQNAEKHMAIEHGGLY